jgi:hypothetical protein
VSVTLLSIERNTTYKSGHKFLCRLTTLHCSTYCTSRRSQGTRSAYLRHCWSMTSKFNTALVPVTRVHAGCTSRRSDHTTPPIPRPHVSGSSLRKHPPAPAPPTSLNDILIRTEPLHTSGIQDISSELLLASGIQVDEWMVRLRQEYTT